MIRAGFARPKPRMGRGPSIESFVWVPTIVPGLILAVATLWHVAAAPVTVGGPFTLSAPDGRTVTDRTFAGRWLLVYFGYTSCPDSCPTALADIAKALETLGPDAARVQPIFITLDPRRDTREVIGDYVKSFSSRIIGLTGSQEQIDVVAHAYGAYALPHRSEPAGADDLLDHSVYIYLMDPHGGFVRGFDPSWSPDRMADVVKREIGTYDGGEKRRAATARP